MKFGVASVVVGGLLFLGLTNNADAAEAVNSSTVKSENTATEDESVTSEAAQPSNEKVAASVVVQPSNEKVTTPEVVESSNEKVVASEVVQPIESKEKNEVVENKPVETTTFRTRSKRDVTEVAESVNQRQENVENPPALNNKVGYGNNTDNGIFQDISKQFGQV